jgi:hypothetical protein
MAGSVIAANNNSVYTLPVDIVEMEVSAAFPTNYMLVPALAGRRRRRRHLRFTVANITGQLKIRTCVSAAQ